MLIIIIFLKTEMDVNPIRDMQIITEELCLKDLEAIEKMLPTL